MIISVSTRKSLKRERISSMAEFFLKRLGLDSIDGGIQILTTNKIQLDGLAASTFIPEHNTVVIVVTPKIRDPHIMGLVLAHEFVHAKQFLDGRLQEEDGKQFWLGEDASQYPYDGQPWEVEAYERMFDLADAFLEDFAKSMV
jgi:hypothetical protein